MPPLSADSIHPVQSRYAFIASRRTFTTRRITFLIFWAFCVTSWVLQAQGAADLRASATKVFNVQSGLFSPSGGHITVSATLPAATVGTSYNAVVSVSGGTAPYQFAIGWGVLPPGLTLNA